jgi:uncharacterized protein (TIRG00374 family)
MQGGTLRYLKPAIGLAISALAVLLLARGTDWTAVRTGLTSANPALIAAVVPALLVTIGARAVRWKLFFREPAVARIPQTFRALNIGYMAGNVLPLQMGELVRAYALGEETGISKARILSTVAVERVLDVSVLLVAAVILGPIIGLPAPATFALCALVVAVVLALAIVLVAVVDRARAERWTDRLIRILPSRFEPDFMRVRDAMLDGVEDLGNVRTLVAMIAWTVAAWCLSAALVYMLLRAMQVDVPLAAAPFLLIVTTFAFFIPSSPGAVGVYDAAAVTALVTAFDVDRELATSYAIVAHASYLVPPTILGALFFWRMHLRLPKDMHAVTDAPAGAMEDRRPPGLSQPVEPS